MPQLENLRYEHFCQLMVEGQKAVDAYAIAGYRGKPEKGAHRIANRPEVLARIAELRQRSAKRHDVTMDSLTGMLMDAYDSAMESEQIAAAVSAVKTLGQMHGIIDTSAKVNIQQNTIQVKDMGPREVARRLVFLMEQGAREDADVIEHDAA